MVGVEPPVTNRFKPPGRSVTRIVEEWESGENEIIVGESKKNRADLLAISVG